MKKNYRTTKLLMFLFFSFALVISAKASIYPFTLTYSGANENPSNASTATGTIMGTYDDFTKRIFYTVTFSGLTTPATGAHFHSPATTVTNAPVIIPFTGFPAATSGTYSGSSLVTTTQETDLFAGKWYANIHSSTYPGGELRVQVILGAASTAIYSFNNMYRGTNEVPSNASTATGTVMGTFNSATNRIIYTIMFSGLAGNPTGSHFHGPAGPGTNAPVLVSLPGFPAATSGSYSGTSVLSDLFETQFLSNLWYANLHDATFPGGEIRAQLIPMLPPTITCPANKVVSNSPGLCSASVAFIATSTGVPAPTIIYRIGTTVITSPYVFADGITTVTATASNSAGTASCTFTVTVNDTEAPVIHNLSASPNSLWPPNHKMKDVAVNYTTTDNCPGPISCTLSVTSNEAVNGTGDGNTSPDWVVINDHNVQLRAERAGGGDGRIYTITTTCHDQNGNTSSATTTVTVGHDKGKSNKRTESSIKDETTVKGISGLSIRVLNNPSRDHFTLNIQTNNLDKITVRLIDLYGRVIESKFNLSGSQVLQIGSNLNAGTYQVELQQGKQRTQLKLVKIR